MLGEAECYEMSLERCQGREEQDAREEPGTVLQAQSLGEETGAVVRRAGYLGNLNT